MLTAPAPRTTWLAIALDTAHCIVVAAIAIVMLTTILTIPAAAESLPIVLEGEFSDWTSTSKVATDPLGDDGSSGVDFHDLWMANDQDYLYVRFETTAEVQGDENQSLRLYLDTDMNVSTGQSYNGIGADLVWDFGARDGEFRGSAIDHSDIGLLLGPTVSNMEFEIALRLDAVPVGGQSLFPSTTVRLILRDMASGGDLLPNGGSVAYTMDPDSQPTTSLELGEDEPEHVRVASFNIQGDGLFDGGSRDASLDRIFSAIDAELWVLNEVWDHNAQDVQGKLEQYLPSGTGESWYTVMRDNGNVIGSRYPILDSWEILPGNRLTGALIDLQRQEPPFQLLVVACHFRCCSADFERQREADALVGFLRDAKTAGGVIDLPQDTPMIAAGDFNLVGLRRQLDTILTGDIVDNGSFGPDYAPDWDGSGFDIPPSRHSDARVGYTWRRDTSSFYPGLLDYIFYTASSVDLGNHYILDTRTMHASSLASYGLQSGDTENASDHSPRVADLVLSKATSAPPTAITSLKARLLPNVPNPFNPNTELRFGLDDSAEVRLIVYDARGRRVRDLGERRFEPGQHGVTWNGRDDAGRAVASGVYQVRMIATLTDEVLEDVVKVTLVE